MSQDKVPYSYTYRNQEITSINQFAKLPCCLHWSQVGYEPPGPEEIKALMRLAGWTNNETARLLDLHYTADKGSPTLGRWRASKNSKSRKQIPNVMWRLLLIYANVIKNPRDDLKYLIKL